MRLQEVRPAEDGLEEEAGLRRHGVQGGGGPPEDPPGRELRSDKEAPQGAGQRRGGDGQPVAGERWKQEFQDG